MESGIAAMVSRVLAAAEHVATELSPALADDAPIELAVSPRRTTAGEERALLAAIAGLKALLPPTGEAA